MEAIVRSRIVCSFGKFDTAVGTVYACGMFALVLVGLGIKGLAFRALPLHRNPIAGREIKKPHEPNDRRGCTRQQ